MQVETTRPGPLPPARATGPGRDRRRRAVAALVVLVVVAAACSSTKSSASHETATTTRPTTTTTASTSSTTTTPTGSSSTTSGASTSTTASGGTPNCPTSQLSAALQPSQGAAGHVITPLSLTNHGTSTCVLSGYPGVSLLDAGGNAMQTPATRATRPVTTVVLGPGVAAVTDLESQNEGISPTPCWAASTSIKIYPPNQLGALTIPGVFQVCGGEFTVTPMAAS